jgi:bifunctional DNase/RNase
VTDVNEGRCQFADCDQWATMHFVRAEERRASAIRNFCDTHGKLHADAERVRHYSPSRLGAGTKTNIGSGVYFGIDFLFVNELQDRPWGHCRVGLIECGGNRKFDFQIGPCECRDLDFELQRYSFPRPLKHQTTAAIISVLGGRLKYIEIDKYIASQATFEAKLHIHQMNADVVVDSRPSDALVLAVILDVPIVVSDAVLARLPNQDGTQS